jgi:toxin-antitoxin system PIN domain toxin
VILVDANVLVYAHVVSAPQHVTARRWLEKQFNDQPRVGLPWQSLLGFVRVVSNPRIFPNAESIGALWSRVEEWLDLENVWIPIPTGRHREVLGNLLHTISGGSKLVPDAHLAALALEHGLTLCSTDGDFARFPGLRWENPVSGAA